MLAYYYVEPYEITDTWLFADIWLFDIDLQKRNFMWFILTLWLPPLFPLQPYWAHFGFQTHFSTVVFHWVNFDSPSSLSYDVGNLSINP